MLLYRLERIQPRLVKAKCKLDVVASDFADDRSDQVVARGEVEENTGNRNAGLASYLGMPSASEAPLRGNFDSMP